MVQTAGDDVRLETAVHQRAEHTCDLSHKEGCRHTLAADITHAEVEQIVDEGIAVEVATHLLRRRHHRIEIHISATGEDVREHAFLDFTGDAEFTLDALLSLRGLFQLVVGSLQLAVGSLHILRMLVAAVTVEDEEGDDECCDDTTCREHHMIPCQLHLLHIVLSVGEGKLGIELVRLSTGLRRLDGVNHRTGLLLPIESLLQVAHVFVDRGFLGTFVLLMGQLVSTLQGQLPLFAVLGLIDVDKLAEESTLSSELGNQLSTLLIGLLETKAITLVIAGQTFIRPSRDLVHGEDARLVERLAGILLHLLVIFPVEGCLTKT